LKERLLSKQVLLLGKNACVEKRSCNEKTAAIASAAPMQQLSL